MLEYRRGPAQKAPRPLSTVVSATPADLDDLVWFLHAMRDEIEGGAAEEEVLVALASALVRKAGGVALIVRGEKVIEASMGLAVETPILSRRKRLRVLWNCVLPEARVTGHAKSLMIRAREMADSLKCDILLHEVTPDPENGKVKLAGRHMKANGHVFLYSPETA